MWMDTWWRSVVCGLVTLAVVGCGADAPASDPAVDASPAQEQSTAPEQLEADESAAPEEPEITENQSSVEITMPDGAEPGSDEFPFPVPREWAQLDPFEEVKVGASMRMYAAYEHTGDAASAAAMYRDLLTSAGYTITANPLLEVTNDAAFTVEGPVNGDPHTGSVAFDKNAEGVQRAVIDLQKDE